MLSISMLSVGCSGGMKNENAALKRENQRLVDAKRLALENPMAVANIVKSWVNGEAPA